MLKWKTWLFMALMTTWLPAYAFDLSCSIRATCIRTQGTKIPSGKVIEISDLCDDFIKNDVGRRMLRMSLEEINNVSKGNYLHPVAAAQYAFDRLRDSPLKFVRKPNVEDTNYIEIKTSCLQLNRDFYDDSKWSK